MACTSCGIAFNTGSADICPTNPCPSLEVAARVPAHEDFVRSGLLRQLLCNLALECLSCSGAAQPARQQVPLLLSFTFLHLPSPSFTPSRTYSLCLASCGFSLRLGRLGPTSCHSTSLLTSAHHDRVCSLFPLLLILRLSGAATAAGKATAETKR